MAKKNQKIKCNVETCKHNDCEQELCQLSEIKVGCGCDDTNCKDDTICVSFEEEKNDI